MDNMEVKETKNRNCSEAQKRALKKYYEKNKERLQNYNREASKNKYHNDELYREKAKEKAKTKYNEMSSALQILNDLIKQQNHQAESE